MSRWGREFAGGERRLRWGLWGGIWVFTPSATTAVSEGSRGLSQQVYADKAAGLRRDPNPEQPILTVLVVEKSDSDPG